MRLTFLGTGTSQGIPVIACDCSICTSADPKDNRLRSSVMITIDTQNYVIDTGPDFRQQMLREKVLDVRAILFTHEHKDHVAGMDDIRAFNFKHQKDMDVYCDLNVQKALLREYPYVFTDFKYPGVPEVVVHQICKEDAFTIDGNLFTPIEVMHYKLPVLGFRVKNLTYITDAKTISDTEIEKIKGSKVLVVNALRRTEHISHFNLKQALELIAKIKPEKAYITHLSHLMGLHSEVSLELPANVFIAYDGLHVEC
jgi:phosphoribosyl 1,2-cyclic phosphate phosphodiesterase